MTKPKNTIGDKDWQSLQDRARKANPEPSIFDPKGTKDRIRARDNYRNRDNN